jgi:hypothetical protein
MTYSVFRHEFVGGESGGIKKIHPKMEYSKQRQTGHRISLSDDKKRRSLQPGKRISKTGHSYYEYRKNRTDLEGGTI